jgi:nicotinamidase/pyrazinamidase
MLTIDRTRAVLLLVDIQPDFLPGGRLPVSGGDEILEPVDRLMRADRFGLCVATQDWHPRGHISFASRHGRRPFERVALHGHRQTLWPDHCVQGTPGAALHPALPWDRVEAIIRKGTDPQVDSYSGFRNNWNASGERPPTGLGGYLRDRGVTQVVVCGLARDVCVKWTAEDAAAAGFATAVVWDLTRPVDPSADDDVRAALADAGVAIVQAREL